MKNVLQIACLFLCMMMAETIWSQEATEVDPADLLVPARTEEPNEVPGPSVRESLPKIVYIFDDKGNLVPWIGSFPWKKYDELEQLSRPFRAPKFVVLKLTLEAEAEQDHAILATTMTIRLLEDGRHVVPIRMGTVHFSKPPSSTGKPVFAQFNRRHGEYELLVEGEAGEEVEVAFESQLAIQRIGPESRLKLSVPRVAVSSLSVLVRSAPIQAHLENALVTTTPEGASASRLEVRGLPQEVDLSWRPALRGEEYAESSFEVEGDIEVQVDALGGITSDAVLSINSFTRLIDSVVVLLPEGMRWSDVDQESLEYRITPLESNGRRHRLQVMFRERSLKPPAIRLRAKSEGELSKLELAGFEVEGAQTQFGEVRLDSEGDRQLEWSIGEFARRIEKPGFAIPPEASFAYSRTNQLLLTVTKQSTELIVEPIYELMVEETRITLTAIFVCGKRGANPAKLVFDMQGWTLPGLGRDPDNVVGYLDELLFANDQLELPLVDPPDRFEVSFTATMPLEHNLADLPGTRIDLHLPTPTRVSSLLQSTVAISTPPNVTVAQQGSVNYSEINLPDRIRADLDPGDNPLCLRLKSIGPPPPLPIVAAKLQRKVNVVSELEIIDVDANQLMVRQQMQWRVSDVPLRHALLTMNDDVLNGGDLKIAVNDESVVYRPSPTFGDYTTDTVTIQVPLQPMLGNFDMTVSYNVQRSQREDIELSELGTVEAIDLPLVQPKRSTSTSAQAIDVQTRFRTPRIAGYQIGVPYDRNVALQWPWKTSTDMAVPIPEMEAVSDPSYPSPPTILPLSLKQIEETEDTTDFEELVDRAWFQTWYTHSTRTDRAVFRVQRGGTTLRVRVPQSIRHLNALVDGQPKRFQRQNGVIELEVDPTAASYVVELQYSVDSREPPGRLETEVPRIEGADVLGQWYWHIVMPRNECLVTWPRNLTRADQWDWSVLIPRRKPQLTLAELEDWSGGTETGAKVLAGSSEYLFGAMGETEQLTIRTATLPVYVMVVAGSILVIGLVFVYSGQRTIVLLAVATLISGLVLVHPSSASIAGQVSVFGVLLVAAASFMSRTFRDSNRSLFGGRAPFSSKPASQLVGGSSVISQDTTALVPSSSHVGSGGFR